MSYLGSWGLLILVAALGGLASLIFDFMVSTPAPLGAVAIVFAIGASLVPLLAYSLGFLTAWRSGSLRHTRRERCGAVFVVIVPLLALVFGVHLLLHQVDRWILEDSLEQLGHAIVAYNEVHGQYPASLNELVPEHLRRLPPRGIRSLSFVYDGDRTVQWEPLPLLDGGEYYDVETRQYGYWP